MSSPPPSLNEKTTIPFWGTGKQELTYIHQGCTIATAAPGSECLFFEPKQYTVAVKASSIKVFINAPGKKQTTTVTRSNPFGGTVSVLTTTTAKATFVTTVTATEEGMSVEVDAAVRPGRKRGVRERIAEWLAADPEQIVEVVL